MGFGGWRTFGRMTPTSSSFRDVFYLPFHRQQPWGLFYEGGKYIPSTIDHREGSLTPSDQCLDQCPDLSGISELAPHRTYIYGGRINPHYGHFLVNTLPRFWAMSQIRSPSTPILCHAGVRPTDWFSLPFIATAFRLMGLSANDFVQFDRPIRIRNLVVPSTSFEEQYAGYRTFQLLCNAIGRRACAAGAFERDRTPIYYSKSRLKSAVGVIVNEHEVERMLQAAGVKVVYPETLGLLDQIQLMSSRDNIIGTAGSFLHTSIFCPPRRITCLNVTEKINANYVIVDKLNNNLAAYYYAPALRVLNKQDGFLTARYLPDAAIVAEESRCRVRNYAQPMTCSRKPGPF